MVYTETVMPFKFGSNLLKYLPGDHIVIGNKIKLYFETILEICNLMLILLQNVIQNAEFGKYRST